MVKKNEIETVRIENLGVNGEGVATLPDGMKMFVPFALRGEIVRARVLAIKKSFCFGRLEEILIPAAERVTPPCPVFGKCGGCQLQHLEYRAQRDFKRLLVKDALAKIAHIDAAVDETVSVSEPYGYRNKIQLPVGTAGDGSLRVGFYRTNSHDIVPIDACPLHGDWAAKLIAAFKDYARRASVRGYNEETRRGDVRHLVARKLGDRILVCAVVPKKLPSPELFCDILKQTFPDFALLVNYNCAETNVILGDRTELLYGENKLDVDFDGIRAEIAVESFLQVNLPVAKALYRAASEAADITDADTVIDAYSGAGILSACFARRAKAVFGLEICLEASRDADRLKAVNRIENLTNRNGDCAVLLPRLADELEASAVGHGKRVVVLDPPRKGCDAPVLDAVKRIRPDRIVYISCNPATLARDLAELCADGAYALESATPFDMFPETSHVETLVVLRTKKSPNSNSEESPTPGIGNLK